MENYRANGFLFLIICQLGFYLLFLSKDKCALSVFRILNSLVNTLIILIISRTGGRGGGFEARANFEDV